MKKCFHCNAFVPDSSKRCEECGTWLVVPRKPLARRLGFLGFFVVLVGLLILGGIIFNLWVGVADDMNELEISPGDEIVGSIGPETPMGMANKPFVDYELIVPSYGEYEINLVSMSPEMYNPYLSLLRDNQMLAVDDDSGEGVNAMVRHTLRPETYTVRVTRREIGPLEAPVEYSLSIARVNETLAAR